MCSKTGIILKRLEIFFFALLILLLCASLILFAPSVGNASTLAVERCLNIIIPSLFAFMAVSQIVISSGVYKYISMPFYPIAKYVTAIPPELFFVFLMGSLAGYPVGIKLLGDMKSKGTVSDKTAEIMSVFCCCGGPAFYSGTVGLAVFGSQKIGMLIFVSVLGANFLSACLICRIKKPEGVCRATRIKFSAETITSGVRSAGSSLFTICAMIIFCSALLAVIDSLGLFRYIQSLFGLSDNEITLIRSCLEITNLTQIQGMPYNLLPYIAAVCSFGGFCVIAQILALNGAAFSLKYFILSRPFNAALSALICYLCKPLFLPDAVEAAVYKKVLVNFNNFVPSICLILMILLLNLKKSLVFSKKL
ncbi:MAG: nucleoside recognition protein [Ruminococcus sp.]|nr:nucleoside recognition protein [Ruminococcus sp.]